MTLSNHCILPPASVIRMAQISINTLQRVSVPRDTSTELKRTEGEEETRGAFRTLKPARCDIIRIINPAANTQTEDTNATYRLTSVYLLMPMPMELATQSRPDWTTQHSSAHAIPHACYVQCNAQRNGKRVTCEMLWRPQRQNRNSHTPPTRAATRDKTNVASRLTTVAMKTRSQQSNKTELQKHMQHNSPLIRIDPQPTLSNSLRVHRPSSSSSGTTCTSHRAATSSA